MCTNTCKFPHFQVLVIVIRLQNDYFYLQIRLTLIPTAKHFKVVFQLERKNFHTLELTFWRWASDEIFSELYTHWQQIPKNRKWKIMKFQTFFVIFYTVPLQFICVSPQTESTSLRVTSEWHEFAIRFFGNDKQLKQHCRKLFIESLIFCKNPVSKIDQTIFFCRTNDFSAFYGPLELLFRIVLHNRNRSQS